MWKRALSCAALLAAALALGSNPSSPGDPEPPRGVCTLTPPVSVCLDCTDEMNGGACLSICVTPRVPLRDVQVEVAVDGRVVRTCSAGRLSKSQSHTEGVDVSYPSGGGAEVVVTVRAKTMSGEPVAYATGMKVGTPSPTPSLSGRPVQTPSGLKGIEYAVEPR